MVMGGVIEFITAFLWDLITGRPFKINHRFTVTKELGIASLPIWGLIALIASKDNSTANLFFLAMVIGPLFEIFLGKGLHHLFGIRVWSYQYASIGGYTSILIAPYWGGAALLFLALAKLFGI